MAGMTFFLGKDRILKFKDTGLSFFADSLFSSPLKILSHPLVMDFIEFRLHLTAVPALVTFSYFSSVPEGLPLVCIPCCRQAHTRQT